MSVRVVIVDDHRSFAEGMARMIAADAEFELVGIAATAASARDCIAMGDPDVAIVDVGLPDADGITLTREIVQRWSRTKVVMLSPDGGPEIRTRALAAGCADVLAKEQSAKELFEVVRTIAQVEPRGHGASAHQFPALSPREYEVLRLLAKTMSTGAIAERLEVSFHTVRNHLSSILGKLGAHSKLEAVAIATRIGILSAKEIG